jgi:hypothetical protein
VTPIQSVSASSAALFVPSKDKLRSIIGENLALFPNEVKKKVPMLHMKAATVQKRAVKFGRQTGYFPF